MHSIAARSFAVAPIAAPTPAQHSTADSTAGAAGGGDLLSAMRPAMNAAQAVGAPMNAQDASSVLATGGSYIAGATRTLEKLEEGITKKQERIEQLRGTNPQAADDEQKQLEMLEKLRDRIKLSIERVGDILTGRSSGDVEDTEDHQKRLQAIRDAGHERAIERNEQTQLLEQRRQMLAPSIDSMVMNTMPSAMVAGQYAGGTVSVASGIAS